MLLQKSLCSQFSQIILQKDCVKNCFKLSSLVRKYSIKSGIFNNQQQCYLRHFHTSSLKKFKDLETTERQVATREHIFESMQVKDKKAFLDIINVYDTKIKMKRGHVEFIYAALKQMEEFGVQNDVEVYKKIMDVFPKGKMIPKNLIQAELFHFPKHQDCAIAVLDQMEHLGVFLDQEMGDIILAVFGKSSYVYKKFCKMKYWMLKFKNLNPYMLPQPLTNDTRQLARYALKKMSVDSRTKFTEFEAKDLQDSVDKTWIISAQSPIQQKLIEEHEPQKSLFVEGPFLEWLQKISITYFVLKADSKIYIKEEDDDDDVSNISLRMFGDPVPNELTVRPRSVHEQEDGTIMAMCCSGTSSKDSLLSWIRFLQNSNPKLNNIPVLFSFKSSPNTLVAVNVNKQSTDYSTECNVSDDKAT